MTSIRQADSAHLESWARLRSALWPDESPEELECEARLYFAGEAKHLRAVLFAHAPAGDLVGFAELNIRPYAEGCVTDRVAFLEGWYVSPEFRGQGVGAALIAACEEWALANGCSELASDALLENADGRAAHLAVGFEEVESIVCFRKQLPSGTAPGGRRAP